GRVLMNGNAETPSRFCALGSQAAGPSRHRDPRLRSADRVLIVTASWGPGELNDQPLRGGFAAQKRGEADNLRLWTAMTHFLQQRPVVRGLLAEHTDAWEQLREAYATENDALTSTMRDAWARARRSLGIDRFPRLLKQGDRQAPGPPTRPVHHLLEHALALQVQRNIEGLVRADDLRAQTLRELWEHFRLAAGLEFDSLWQEQRIVLRERILQASLVAIAGGNPSVLLTALRFFDLDGVFVEAVRRGVHVYGSSAGAMVMGQRVIIFHDRRRPRQEFLLLDNGIGLSRGVQIFPHVHDRLHTEDPFNLAYLSARFRHRLCVGLNAGSTLALQPHQGEWLMWSAGDEDLVVFGPEGNKLRAAPGKRIIP
ncbi:MAG: hypothetical protein ACI8RZ_005333, partial [Myxococcota bacterium]